MEPTPQIKPAECTCEGEGGSEIEMYREGTAEHMIDFENAVQNIIFVR